ncbi:hypothetical protein PanWU01x14_299090, partial [Parasponia andersonii]
MEHLGFVENLDIFNKQPWGLESYKRTIASLEKDIVKNSINNRKNDKERESYTLYGFPYAFQ